MSSSALSYKSLIGQLNAFADGHYIIRKFTFGEETDYDLEKEGEYPAMHLLHPSVSVEKGAINYDLVIQFADLPRDIETKTTYQMEQISDLFRLGQDLLNTIANENGVMLFGEDAEIIGTPRMEAFAQETKNNLVVVSLSFTLQLPNDWSACDIPADWTIGQSGGDTPGVPVVYVISVTGLDTDNTDPQNPIVRIAVDGTTITGEGTPEDPLVAVGGGAVEGVTGNIVDNTDPQNPIVTQVQSDWNQSDNTQPDFIKNKPTIPTDTGITQLTGDVTAGPGNGSQSSTIANDAVTYAKMQNVSAESRLLGRGAGSGSGDVQEITLGTRLSMSGTILNCSAVGTVTSVGLSAPSEFTVSNSPVTGSGTLTFTKANQNANIVYAGPTTGAAAAPTFRSLVDADIPAGIARQDSAILTAGTVTTQTVASGATNYGFLNGVSVPLNANATNNRSVVPVGGTLSRFYLYTTGSQSATGSLVSTIRSGGVDSSITITIAAGAAGGVFSDTTNTLAVSAGDMCDVKFVNNATAASITLRSWSSLLTR